MMMTGRDQSQNIRPTVNTVQCRMNQKIVINIVIKFRTTHIFTAHTFTLVFFVADMTVIIELRVFLPGSLLLE